MIMSLRAGESAPEMKGRTPLEIKQLTDVRTSLNIYKSSGPSCKVHRHMQNWLIEGGIERSICMLQYRLLSLVFYENAGLKMKVPVMTFQKHRPINLNNRDF